MNRPRCVEGEPGPLGPRVSLLQVKQPSYCSGGRATGARCSPLEAGQSPITTRVTRAIISPTPGYIITFYLLGPWLLILAGGSGRGGAAHLPPPRPPPLSRPARGSTHAPKNALLRQSSRKKTSMIYTRGLWVIIGLKEV